MEIFMIGNGFDLHYCLPTTYTCFLHTVDHVSKQLNSGKAITSVAQLLSDPELYSNDPALKRCYQKYGTSYNAELDSEVIKRYFKNASDNMWFSYLLTSFNSGNNWIDFEREIGQVIQIISSSLQMIYDRPDNRDPNQPAVMLSVPFSDKRTNYVLSKFSFFFQTNPSQKYTERIYLYPISSSFLYESPHGSGDFSIDQNAISQRLYSSLREFADMLSAYLSLFVDAPVKNLFANGTIPLDPMLQSWPWEDTQIVSFNYTHTLQTLYLSDSFPQCPVHYLHGQLRYEPVSDIVLGIDADENDELTHANTTFVMFKKYFQRSFYQSDLSYNHLIHLLNQKAFSTDSINLYVIGHSLDKTDREIIRKMFLLSTRIIVFFHSYSAVSDYIRNLVSIFGKEEFEHLRTDRNLRFFPLESVNHSIDALLNNIITSNTTLDFSIFQRDKRMNEIGVDEVNGKPISLDLMEKRSVAIYGKKQFGKTSLLRILLNNAIKLYPDLRLVLVDDGRQELSEKHLNLKGSPREIVAFRDIIEEEWVMMDGTVRRMKRSPLMQFYVYMNKYYIGWDKNALMGLYPISGDMIKERRELANLPDCTGQLQPTTVFVLQTKQLFLNSRENKYFLGYALPALLSQIEEKRIAFIFSDIKKFTDPDNQQIFSDQLDIAFILGNLESFAARQGKHLILGNLEALLPMDSYFNCELGEGYSYDVQTDSLKRIRFFKE